MHSGWEWLNDNQEWVPSTLKVRSGIFVLTIPHVHRHAGDHADRQGPNGGETSEPQEMPQKRRKAWKQVDIVHNNIVYI